jgi:alkylhydroperoxidase family enzyme
MSPSAAAVPIGGMPVAPPVFQPIGYDDLPPALREALRARVERLGYIGGFFAFAAPQPRALEAFNAFSETLRENVPMNLVEIVALAVSTAYGSVYESTQHRRLAATHGHGPDWIDAAAGTDDNPLSDAERAVRTLVQAMVRTGGHGVRDELERVYELLDREQTVGVLLLAVRYIGHAHMANALELTEPPPAHRSA